MQAELFKIDSELEKKFKEFDRRNPQVYKSLVDLAYQLRERGHKVIGIKMLIEVVRWQTKLKTTDEDYKINNNYAPFYARKIMNDNPSLDGMFNLREQRK